MENPIKWLGVEINRENGVAYLDCTCQSCDKNIREVSCDTTLEQKGMIVCPHCEAKYYKHNFSAGSHGVMSVWIQEEDVLDVRDKRIKFKVKTGKIYCVGFKREGN